MKDCVLTYHYKWALYGYIFFFGLQSESVNRIRVFSEGICVNKHVRMCAYLEGCPPVVNAWRHSGLCPGDYFVSVGAGCSGPGRSTWSWESRWGSSDVWSIPRPQTPPAQIGDRTSGVSTWSRCHRNNRPLVLGDVECMDTTDAVFTECYLLSIGGYEVDFIGQSLKLRHSYPPSVGPSDGRVRRA